MRPTNARSEHKRGNMKRSTNGSDRPANRSYLVSQSTEGGAFRRSTPPSPAAGFLDYANFLSRAVCHVSSTATRLVGEVHVGREEQTGSIAYRQVPFVRKRKGGWLPRGKTWGGTERKRF